MAKTRCGFVEGAGLFCLHIGDEVFGAVRKERSDFGSRPHSALV